MRGANAERKRSQSGARGERFRSVCGENVLRIFRLLLTHAQKYFIFIIIILYIVSFSVSLSVSFSVSLAVSFSPHKPLEFRKVGVSLAVSLVVSLVVSLAVSLSGSLG